MSTKREPSTFGRNLRRRRKALGMTSDALNHAAGVTCVRRVETGQTRVPSEGAMEALAGVLECTVADLWDETTDSAEVE